MQKYMTKNNKMDKPKFPFSFPEKQLFTQKYVKPPSKVEREQHQEKWDFTSARHNGLATLLAAFSSLALFLHSLAIYAQRRE